MKGQGSVGVLDGRSGRLLIQLVLFTPPCLLVSVLAPDRCKVIQCSNHSSSIKEFSGMLPRTLPSGLG